MRDAGRLDVNNHAVDYLLRQLCGFYKLRDEFLVILDAYGKRLAQQAPGPATMGGESQAGFSATLSARLAALWHPFARIGRILGLLPALLKQRRQIARLSEGMQPGVVLATASNRLHSNTASARPREYFAALARQFDGQEPHTSVEHAIRTASPLFICDPQFESRLRGPGAEQRADDIVVLDAVLLIFLGVLAVVSGRSCYFWPLLRSRQEYRSRRRVSAAGAWIELLAAGLLIEGYRSALGQRPTTAYFLTSNSFATEILRFHLIIERSCESMCELMHGIPTTMYERYLADMLATGATYAASDRHSSIPQLPHLPMFGVLERDVKCPPSVAINSYLNSYWMRRRDQVVDIKAHVRAEIERMQTSIGLRSDMQVLTFFGGMSQYRDCFRSESFATECRLMSHANRLLRASGRPFIMIYTPHPGYRLADFEAHPYFAAEGIRIYPDTIFSWLISDLCMALYSSALFEAVHFGVRAFTPTLASDDLFPAVLLDLLDHPGDARQPYLDSLTGFLDENMKRPAADVMQRALQRADLFGAWQ